MNERIDTPGGRLCQANSRVPIQARAKITKEALLAGAATCFTNHGYAGTSINDITAETSATKGALYFHFSSKTEVARHILDRWTQTVADLVHVGLSVEGILRELAARAERDPLARAAILLGVDPAAVVARAGYQSWQHQLLRPGAAAREAGWAEYGSHHHRLTETLCAGFVGVVIIANSAGAPETIPDRAEDLLTACQDNTHHHAEEMAL